MIKPFLILAFSISSFAFADDEILRESNKGFFGLGGFYGAGASRYLNADGNFADYKTTQYGLDLDVRIWDAGSGDIRLFAVHTVTDGKSTSSPASTLHSAETAFGIKFYAGNHLYLSGAWGQGNASLKSAAQGTDLSLTYDLMRAALGLQFAMTDSLHIAIEADYKEAPLRKNDNPELVSNSFFEGMSGSLRLIWSPPSVSVTVNRKN